MKSSYTNNNARRLVILGLFIALIIIQSWVPFLGFITIGPIAMTIIPITVILSTLWLSTRDGMILGLVFGLNSLVRAWLIGNPVERMIFTSPLVSVLPRILMPLLLGLCIKYILDRFSDSTKGAVAGFIGSILNTILVLGAIGIFKPTEYIGAIDGANVSQLWPILWGIVTANGIPEAILATIITPIIFIGVNRSRR
ncbi:MAG: ECF transporter S component [Ruoffia tabacinasalis]|uniref:ECF transporter S component n=1 Tax=unclassified Ruoffia TaxID=2862149 RepID=UPI003887D940